MRYQFLGSTGIRISEFCLGAWKFGTSVDEGTAISIIQDYIGQGGNFIDTANAYAWPTTGVSESVVGKALKGRREGVVIATKVRFPMGEGPNDAGLSRFHIREQVEASLRRLRTDRIDIYNIHSWDERVPIEETLRALDDLVHAGKILYIGCSNLTGWQLMSALAISSMRGWARFSCYQGEYSLLSRGIEREIIPACWHEKLGVLAWSPLGGGFLSGKYHPGASPPAGSRYDGRIEFPEGCWKVMEIVEDVATRHGRSATQISLAWLLSRPGITAPILGVRTKEQLAENMGATSVQLSDADMQRLDEASAVQWGFPYDFQRRTADRR